MIFKIITLFPEFFESPLKTGLLGKAIDSGKIVIEVIDLRKFSDDKFRRCDDYPYGGGSGMVLLADPLFKAVKNCKTEETEVIIPSARGQLLNQDLIKKFSQKNELCFICGHYEGIDQRVIDEFSDYEVSIGDYILSGGEFSTLVIVDAVARYVPGFMSNEESLLEESFENDLLEYPQYTRPSDYEDMAVPEVLLSGNHEKIKNWRLEKSIEKTRKNRPDLFKRYLKRKLTGE